MSVVQVLCYIRHMARGQSGRVVLEIDPMLKRRLHARLASDGLTLKDWFLERVDRYLHQPTQESLPLGEATRPTPASIQSREVSDEPPSAARRRSSS